jgi:hypothetical protein
LTGFTSSLVDQLIAEAMKIMTIRGGYLAGWCFIFLVSIITVLFGNFDSKFSSIYRDLIEFYVVALITGKKKKKRVALTFCACVM